MLNQNYSGPDAALTGLFVSLLDCCIECVELNYCTIENAVFVGIVVVPSEDAGASKEVEDGFALRLVGGHPAHHVPLNVFVVNTCKCLC